MENTTPAQTAQAPEVDFTRFCKTQIKPNAVMRQVEKARRIPLQEKLYTRNQLARILQVSNISVIKWEQAGYLVPVATIRGNWKLFDQDALEIATLCKQYKSTRRKHRPAFVAALREDIAKLKRVQSRRRQEFEQRQAEQAVSESAPK